MSRRWLGVAAAITALCGWALMTVGAFVRASGSGLGCPDWPACRGQVVVGGSHPMIEEAHRWLATALVVGVIALAIGVFRGFRRERALVRATIAILALTVVQVALGGVTVLLQNVSWTVVAHYVTAALLLTSVVALAVLLLVPADERVSSQTFSRLVRWFAALGFGLLIIGSTVANTGSHTACGHNPFLCNGSLLPSAAHRPILNVAHRLLAAGVLVAALWVARQGRGGRSVSPLVRRLSAALAGLVALEAAAGLAVIGLGESVALEVAHSSLASLTWLGMSALLALTGNRGPASVSRPPRIRAGADLIKIDQVRPGHSREANGA